MKPYAFLNFPTPQIRGDFVLPQGTSVDNVFIYQDAELLTIYEASFLDLLRGMGLDPFRVLLFQHKPEYQNQRIHQDNKTAKTSDLTFSINWIYCEGECATQWFAPKIIDDVPYAGEFVVNNPHKALVDGVEVSSPGYTVHQFDRTKLDLVAETNDKGPILLVSSIPHHAINLSQYDRWSVSLRCRHEIQTQEELMAKFQDWIINDRN